ncbi:anti-sigma factor [Kribbella sp. NPDC023855]|uniref:anti-sigma factor n=1 Tax=Kribbella sp. NPDC023855 TaxID=3154698 RepID=UPI0033D32F27
MDDRPAMGSRNRQLSTGIAVEDLMRWPEVWARVPEELLERLMCELDAAPSDPSQRVVRTENVVWIRRRARRLTRSRLIGVAAAGVLVATAGGVWMVGDRVDTYSSTLAGTSLAEGARGRVELRDTASGVEIILDTTDLPAAPAGRYYQGWVKGNRGLVSIGTFHLRGGPSEIVLWSGVDLTDFPTISVTLESEGNGPQSSGQVVLSGPVPGEFR